MRRIICAFLALPLLGCFEQTPTLDTSSEDALKRSAEAVARSLPEAKRKPFGEAVTSVVFGEVLDQGIFAMSQAQKDPAFFIKAAAPLNGKTADEVIKLAADKFADRKQRQLSAADQEIAALKAEIDALKGTAASRREVLAAVSITGARFYRAKNGFLTEGVIAFDIKNNGTIPIKAFYTTAILETPGRSVPWKQDSVNYEVPGGIEPGEQKSLKLLAGYGWDGQDYVDRKDLVLTLTLRDFSGPDGKRVIGSDETDIEIKLKRLDALEKQRATLLPATTN